MQEQKTATLATILSEVLQDLAFMFSDGEEDETTPGEVWLETEIAYEGASCGGLRLLCTRHFAATLATNLLGAEPDHVTNASEAHDAVKEFMNIVCGQLVTAWYGTEDVYNLTIPTIRELPETPPFAAPDTPDVATVYVEGQRLQLTYASG